MFVAPLQPVKTNRDKLPQADMEIQRLSRQLQVEE